MYTWEELSGKTESELDAIVKDLQNKQYDMDRARHVKMSNILMRQEIISNQ